MRQADAVIIGAGAAGLHCAGLAGQRGVRVLLIDHAASVAEKIRISGGGRCNFTNREVMPANFTSANPDFCRSALARYTPQQFIALVERHGIAWHEKHKGQLFCDGSSQQIIDLLLAECARGAVERWQPCTVQAVRHAEGDGFELDTTRGPVRAPQLVVACGGLSIPKIGASDFGYRLARQFGHGLIEPRPALVPLTFDAALWAPFAALSGLSLPVNIGASPARPPEGAQSLSEGRARSAKGAPISGSDITFDEDLLFTHRGLSGPAILQISTHWRAGAALHINLAPTCDLRQQLIAAKAGSKRRLGSVLADLLPRRLADTWLAIHRIDAQQPLAEMRDRDLGTLAAGLQRWTLVPSGNEGYRKAEVTAGGVDTRELSSQSMQSRRVPGLYFIGEVVDVTGWLGGYNFQWAWASAFACAQALRRTG
ncbi:MAG: NAD(P)/FAD-dependent oxidoreductase [Burkholderiaceae bacterium]|nr:NAD(P)/FAD-dependent oxidoreductase [Burkholderiaceae bacterium]